MSGYLSREELGAQGVVSNIFMIFWLCFQVRARRHTSARARPPLAGGCGGEAGSTTAVAAALMPDVGLSTSSAGVTG